MQIPTKKLLRLLDRDQPPEMRRAAALVMGEVGGKDGELVEALLKSLDDEDQAVRLQVIQTIGKLHVERALPLLLERVEQGGVEAEPSAHAAARLGAKATRSLHDLMPKVAPGLRRYIAAALAASGAATGTAKGETAAVAMLRDTDPGVIEAAVRSISGEIPALSQSQRRLLVDQLLALLKDRKARISAVAQSAVLRLLTALADPRTELFFWDRAASAHPPEVRAAALQALGQWITSPSKEQLKQLFTCAADADFRVSTPALVILQNQPVTAAALPEWLALLKAPDPAVRQLALAKVGDQNDARSADALLEQLHHPDRSFREAVLAKLTNLPRGRAALAKALVDAETPDESWALARAQAPFAGDYTSRSREELFSRACRYLEADDRRADALLFLLRSIEPAKLRDRLEERALALRKKKNYAAALRYFRLLTHDPACGFAIRVELSGCGLKVSDHDLGPDAWNSDPSLNQFTQLCQRFEDELAAELPRMKWLDPEDLYYLGFHFAEKEGQRRKLAALALKLVLKRSPRSKTAQAAKSKLRREGLE